MELIEHHHTTINNQNMIQQHKHQNGSKREHWLIRHRFGEGNLGEPSAFPIATWEKMLLNSGIQAA
jgi:hypothetical protein